MKIEKRKVKSWHFPSLIEKVYFFNVLEIFLFVLEPRESESKFFVWVMSCQ